MQRTGLSPYGIPVNGLVGAPAMRPSAAVPHGGLDPGLQVRIFHSKYIIIIGFMMFVFFNLRLSSSSSATK